MIHMVETPPLSAKSCDLLHVTNRLITSNADNYCLLLFVSLSTRKVTVSCDITVTQSKYSLSFR
jgi:hypothetical protein